MKVAAVLGSAGGVCFSASGFKSALSEVGLNTGNALFQYAIWDKIQNPKMRVSLSTKPELVREAADILIIPAANQLYKGFDLWPWVKFIEAVNLPCVVVGLGAQAPMGTDEKIDLPDSVTRFAQVVGERCTEIGVRGEFTRKVLEHIGVTNAVVTGCPSQLINQNLSGADIQKQINALSINKPRRLAVLAGTLQPDTHVAERALWDIARIEKDHLVIFQMVPEILRFLLDGTCSAESNSALSRFHKVVRPDMTIDDFKNYIRKNGKFFSDARSWIDSMAGVDLAIGMRIHGAVAAIQAGRLGICVAFDSRTLELARTMGYPRINANEISGGSKINDIIKATVFSADQFDRAKEQNTLNLWKIFQKSGLMTSFPPPKSVSKRDLSYYINNYFPNLNVKPAGIPDEFDPYDYFVLNPDVLEAKMDPYVHYLNWGIKENRQYKLQS